MNLNESSGEQLQQTLQSMPKGKALMKELVRLTEVSGTSCQVPDRSWSVGAMTCPLFTSNTDHGSLATAGAAGPCCRTQQRGCRPDQGRAAGSAGAVEEL